MVGEVIAVRDDANQWRRRSVSMVSPAQCHLRDWKAVLLLVCWLSLVEGSQLQDPREPSGSAALREPRSSRRHLQTPLQDGHSRPPWGGLTEGVSLMEEGEENHKRWQQSPLTRPKNPRRTRQHTRVAPNCRVERKEVRVRDLGLGFDSDEIILFKFCVGTCGSSRRNYDLALKVLTDRGAIPFPSRKLSTQPCCRPTRFETVSFMDAQTEWRTIRQLSAANCSCVG